MIVIATRLDGSDTPFTLLITDGQMDPGGGARSKHLIGTLQID